jgi:hypothetical protein
VDQYLLSIKNMRATALILVVKEVLERYLFKKAS